MAIQKRKKNYNQALSTSFKLEIPGASSFNYFVQITSLPSLNAAGVETPYKNHQGVVPSNRIDYDPLNVNLLVDEDYENWDYLRLWMHKAAGYAYNTSTREPPISEEMKDIDLHILNSNKQSIKIVRFFGAFPVMLGELSLETSVTDPQPIISSVVFRYQYYDFLKAT